MKPVSDSTSQALTRGDNTASRTVSQNKVEQRPGDASKSDSVKTKDIIFQKAITAVKANSNIVDENKVSALKAQIESGEFPALKIDAGEYWDGLAQNIIDTENDFNK